MESRFQGRTHEIFMEINKQQERTEKSIKEEMGYRIKNMDLQIRAREQSLAEKMETKF